MDIDQIIEKITSNLKKNGFPDKKVTFPKKALENFVKKYDFDLEDVLGSLSDEDILFEIQNEKILFFQEGENISPKKDFDFSNINLDALKKMNPETLKQQAAQMMKNMSSEQMQDIQNKFNQLSDKEKESIMKMSKDIGM